MTMRGLFLCGGTLVVLVALFGTGVAATKEEVAEDIVAKALKSLKGNGTPIEPRQGTYLDYVLEKACEQLLVDPEKLIIETYCGTKGPPKYSRESWRKAYNYCCRQKCTFDELRAHIAQDPFEETPDYDCDRNRPIGTHDPDLGSGNCRGQGHAEDDDRDPRQDISANHGPDHFGPRLPGLLLMLSAVAAIRRFY